MCVCLGKLQKLFAVIVLAVLGCVSLTAKDAVEPVKYVFFFIGDGMGLPQRMVTEEFLRVNQKEGLLMNQFPVKTLTTTSAANSFITDSAASGTALACGVKTNNGSIGVDAKGNDVESVATLAKKNGRKVGIITSVSLDHATPAVFYAHNPSRSNAYAIALQLIDSGFDYFGGGGFVDVNGSKAPESSGNIYELAQAKGFKVVRDKQTFYELKPGDNLPVLASQLSNLDDASAALPYAIDATADDVPLADFVTKGIELLDNQNGFFMMVEGGKIDWLAHGNDIGAMIEEVIAFDEAIKVAHKFALAHPDETLIVVTADHETGGLTLGYANTHYNSYLKVINGQTTSNYEFYRALEQLKKADPALSFDAVKPLITERFGLKFTGDKNDRMVLSELQQAQLMQAFNFTKGANIPLDPYEKYELYGSYDPLTTAISHILAKKAGLNWSTYAHSALPVGTTVFGEEADEFYTANDNTIIAQKLKEAVGKLD